MHTCPVVRNAPTYRRWIASASSCASARTSAGSLPPSSSETRVRFSAAIPMISFPVRTLPVKRDLGDPRVLHEHRADLGVATADDVEHAGRQRGGDALERQHERQRRRRRRLDDGRVAGHEGLRQRCGEDRQRPVERDDDRDHAERQARDRGVQRRPFELADAHPPRRRARPRGGSVPPSRASRSRTPCGPCRSRRSAARRARRCPRRGRRATRGSARRARRPRARPTPGTRRARRRPRRAPARRRPRPRSRRRTAGRRDRGRRSCRPPPAARRR